MQVPVFTIGYTAASASNSSCRDATGFPLPSTGRGIEGEGWLYLKLPFLPFMQKNSQNPRNITFYALKQESTTAETSRPHANSWAVGRVTPCAPLLTSKSASHPNCHFPNALLLRNKLCKCLILQQVTFVAKAPNMPGRVATDFPLPSTGRGIEGGLRVRGGHIQSPLPSVSSCIRTIRRPS